MRMASLLLSVPVLIQAVMPVAAWWRKYLRKALASADSGFAAGLAVAGLAAGVAVTSLAAAGRAAAGVAGWEVKAVVAAMVPNMAAATAVVSASRFTAALRFLCCMVCPRLLSRSNDFRLGARGCGTVARTVAGRWQRKTASCARVAAGSAAVRDE